MSNFKWFLSFKFITDKFEADTNNPNIFYFFCSKCLLSLFYKLISYITMYHTLKFQAIYILHNIQIKCYSYE